MDQVYNLRFKIDMYSSGEELSRINNLFTSVAQNFSLEPGENIDSLFSWDSRRIIVQSKFVSSEYINWFYSAFYYIFNGSDFTILTFSIGYGRVVNILPVGDSLYIHSGSLNLFFNS